MKLSEMVREARSPQHVLVFGDSKTGKTELAGRLAEKFNLKWFDLENGHRTLLKLPMEWQEKIELFIIPDSRTYPIGIETMLKIITGAPCEICHVHGKVGCELCKKAQKPFSRFCLNEMTMDDILVVDSGTQLGNSAMNHVTRNQGDDYKPEWDDYRKQGFMLDRFLSNLQQGKFNAVMCSHTTMAKMEDVQKTKLVPVCGTDNFSRNVAKYFDHVVFCDVGTGKHTFGSSTTYRPQILTGSRTDVAIEKMETSSLLPFFTGKIPPPPQAEVKTVLQNAAQRLASMQGGKK